MSKQATATPPEKMPHLRRISIALCTRNGARFLEEQLESYLAQTRKPDELVACDDGSTDDTMAILEAFQRRAPFPVRIFQNQAALGSTKNFEKAIGLCTGEFIATSDQDDVWLSEKLALCEAAFDLEPSTGMVYTDAEVVDENLTPRGHLLWDAVQFGPLLQRRVRQGRFFEAILRQWIVTGATMMFRSDYRPFVLPIPENWVHDGWIAFIIGSMAAVRLVSRPTLKYRQHGAQQIGGRKLSLRELYEKARELGPPYFRVSLERFQVARDRLQTFSQHVRNPMFLSMVDRKVEHQRRRLAISECDSRVKRTFWAVEELISGNYGRYSGGLTHFAKDVIL
jgi:glycosyltransferase involved in cell wall biosynthesis